MKSIRKRFVSLAMSLLLLLQAVNIAISTIDFQVSGDAGGDPGISLLADPADSVFQYKYDLIEVPEITEGNL